MVHPIIDRLLEVRGIAPQDFEKFLHPSLCDLADPSELPGIDDAAEMILAAIREQRHIVIYGDYDCDGVSATAILVRTIEALAPSLVAAFIPERLGEGYGMSDAAITRLLKEHPDVSLIVTVDNGINAVRQVAQLKARGISVIITDHHLPGEELPQADVTVDTKVNAPAELSDLCGAAIAFLLANRLVLRAKQNGLYDGPSLAGPLLILAGLATVTDIMPLLGQNRILVAEALQRFHKLAPIGLKELYDRAARTGAESLTSRDFGFLLGPRINAAGRIASGMQALELVLSDDREIAREYARIVDELNARRRGIEQTMTEEALGKVVPGAAAQVIDLPDGNPGIAGIVAARVMEKLERRCPVCVLAGGHGSARAPEGCNIRDAFVACADVLITYGGHAQAGGFSVREGMIDEFRERLCDYCSQLPIQSGGADEPDLWIDGSDISLELAESLRMLEPFGEGNREPKFGLRGVRLVDLRQLGQDRQHLAVQIIASDGTRLRAVWWKAGEKFDRLCEISASPQDVVFNLVVSEFGEVHPELKIERILGL